MRYNWAKYASCTLLVTLTSLTCRKQGKSTILNIGKDISCLLNRSHNSILQQGFKRKTYFISHLVNHLLHHLIQSGSSLKAIANNFFYITHCNKPIFQVKTQNKTITSNLQLLKKEENKKGERNENLQFAHCALPP